MRPVLILLALGACLTGAAALLDGSSAEEVRAPEATDTSSVSPHRPSVRGQSCLSGADMREVVAERKVLEPIAAIRAARQLVPRAEIVRVNLCHREGEPLFYLITALRRDGQFVHLTVDSQSGAVAALQ